jgi:hypothetical protein
MITHESHVGRLVEIRFTAPITGTDLDAFAARQRVVDSSGGERIACTDCRGIDVVSPETAARLVAGFRENSTRLGRNGFLVTMGKAVASLQIERVLRHAEHPGRRLFRDRDALIAWLDEVLDGPERQRLRLFVGRA